MHTAGAGKKGAATSAPAETVKKESSRKAVAVIARAIEDADDDGWVNLASVGSSILGATRRFDPTNYGCRNLSTLVINSGGFEVPKEPGKPVFIRRKSTGRKASSRVSGAA